MNADGLSDVDANWAIVVAAVVTAVGGIVVAVIQQFRRENREDHGRVQASLYLISNTMKRVEGKVDSHLDWHIKEANNGRPIRRDNGGSEQTAAGQ